VKIVKTISLFFITVLFCVCGSVEALNDETSNTIRSERELQPSVPESPRTVPGIITPTGVQDAVVLPQPLEEGASTQGMPVQTLSPHLQQRAEVVPQLQTGEEVPVPEILRRTEEGFDVEAKRQQVMKLVDEGIAHMRQNSLDKSFHIFTHGDQFRKGDLYLFVFDITGNCLAHGQDQHMIWKNFWNLKDVYNTPIVQMFTQKAQSGGGWITYQWRGATKSSYVKEFVKEGKAYVVGAGYYPHSKSDAVVSLVVGAVSYFNEIVHARGLAAQDAFGAFTYPLGRFVYGDLYLYAVDFNGINMAHGDRPGLVGVNAWNYQDETGKYVNQEIINQLKNTSAGVWVEYISRRAPKVVYAQKVADKQGNQYFIACGYYPTANREKVVDLVRQGYQYIKMHGIGRATQAFTDPRDDSFRFGDLELFVYDMKGKVIAHGENQELVGTNQWDAKDAAGNYYVQNIIHKAQEGGGWINYKLKNSFLSAYVEAVDVGLERYVIGSGLFSISKQETMLLLARSAAGYLRTRPRIEALGSFSRSNGNFIRGDLFVFVFDPSGIVLAYGDQYNLIWRNVLNVQDDSGKQYVRTLINAARRGPTRLTYTINGAKRVVYAEQVENEGYTYIVGSGYFL
jgi:signal transduction histidine kinase